MTYQDAHKNDLPIIKMTTSKLPAITHTRVFGVKPIGSTVYNEQLS